MRQPMKNKLLSLWYYSTHLQKQHATGFITRIYTGYCWAHDETSVKGIAFDKTQKASPDFNVVEIIPLKIDFGSPPPDWDFLLPNKEANNGTT